MVLPKTALPRKLLVLQPIWCRNFELSAADRGYRRVPMDEVAIMASRGLRKELMLRADATQL